MTERIDALLQQLLTAQRTVTASGVRMNLAQSAEARADFVTEMRWAQGGLDAIRDRILSEFEKVTAQRDEALAACELLADCSVFSSVCVSRAKALALAALGRVEEEA